MSLLEKLKAPPSRPSVKISKIDPHDRFPHKPRSLLTSDEFARLKKIFLGGKTNVEVEARLPIKSREQFGYLKNVLDKEEASVTKVVTHDRVTSINYGKLTNVRKIERDDDIVYEKKVKEYRKTIDTTYGIRFSYATETTIPEEDIASEFEEEVERLKKGVDETFQKERPLVIVRDRFRIRYIYQEVGYTVDLTIINEQISYMNNGTKSVRGGSDLLPEIEVERINPRLPVNVFINAVQDVLMIMNRTDKLQDVVLTNRRLRSGIDEFGYVTKKHNALFHKEPRAYSFDTKYVSKPVNISIAQFINPKLMRPENSWALTVKYDGVRRFLLMDRNGCYTINPSSMAVERLSRGFSRYEGTLIDGELMDDGSFHAFDILFEKKKDLREEPFAVRLRRLEKVASKVSFIELKKYFMDPEKTVYELMADLQDYAADIDRAIDGAIYQSPGPYRDRNTFKWKPVSMMTTDFRLVHKEGDLYIPYVGGEGGVEIPFNPEGVKGVLVDDRLFEGLNPEGLVVECSYDPEQLAYIPERYRFDRPIPNYFTVALNNWNYIQRPVTMDDIYGESLSTLRKYHNKIKKKYLKEYLSSGDVIVDIGSGRGGDIMKWESIPLEKVYSIEPNKENLAELQRRLDALEGEIEVEVETLNIGAEETSKIKKALKKDGNQPNAVVSFFSLTFFPQSEILYKKLLKTLDLIPRGGKIIGAVLDGGLVKKGLEKSRKKEKLSSTESATIKVMDSTSDPTPIFEIVQNDPLTSDVFGQSIYINLRDEQSMVKEQEEWLFFFDHFQKELEKMGIRLIHTEILDHDSIFQILPEAGKEFSKLNRAFVFERSEGESVVVEEQDISSEEPSSEGSTPGVDVIKEFESKGYTLNKGPSFLEAVALSASPTYRKTRSPDKLEAVVKKLRKNVSINTFADLKASKKYLDSSDGVEDAYENYVEAIADLDTPPEDLYELVSMAFKVGVIVRGPDEIRHTNEKEKSYVFARDRDEKIYSVTKGKTSKFPTSDF